MCKRRGQFYAGIPDKHFAKLRTNLISLPYNSSRCCETVYSSEAKNMKQKHEKLGLRVAMAAAGILLNGVSIGFFKRAMFGVDPYQCFANGLANVIPIRFGTLYMLVNLLQLAVVFFLNRRYIGISTFMNLFLLGYVVEFFEAILLHVFGEPAMALRVLFLAIGVVVTCIGAALYYTADLGVSTYDAIPLHISDCKPRIFGRVLPFKVVRIISDLICTGIGVVLGVAAGLGTVITALFMGPLIDYFNR